MSHLGTPYFYSALPQRTRRSGREQGRLRGGDCGGWGYRRSDLALPSPACCSRGVASRLSLSRRPGRRARALSGGALSRLRLSTARKRRGYGSVARGNGLAGRHPTAGRGRARFYLSTASVPTFGCHGISESCVWVMPVAPSSHSSSCVSYLCLGVGISPGQRARAVSNVTGCPRHAPFHRRCVSSAS